MCLLRTWAVLWGAAFVPLCLAGCKDAKLPEINVPGLDQAKEAVTNTVETAKQTANIAGKFELDVSGAVTTAGCYARLHLFRAGRPAVLELTSYNDPSNETFPSVMMQARLDEAAVASLAGKTVQAQVYIQTAANGPVWYTSSDAPVELVIESIDEKVVQGRVAQGSLTNTDTGAQAPLTGKFTGNLR